MTADSVGSGGVCPAASSVASWLAQGRTKPRVVVLAAPGKARVGQALEQLIPFLERTSDLVAVDQRFELPFRPEMADVVVVLGGDGSVLQAARQMGMFQIPVLGVNLGRLGFLTSLGPDAFTDIWPRVVEGDFTVTEHLMLETVITRDGLETARQIGLNEAAVLGGPPYHMLHIDLYVDGILATTYDCDGLIISTPVGSTPHNRPAGGPILRKDLQAFVISPLSPHALTMRPVVDRADRQYGLQLTQPHPSASLVVDGRVVGGLDCRQRITIRRAEPTFRMMCVPDQNDYATLRDKLGWSGRAQGRRDPTSGD
jgi:NAD+ kinase